MNSAAQLELYLEGRLSAAEEDSIDRHLTLCECCQTQITRITTIPELKPWIARARSSDALPKTSLFLEQMMRSPPEPVILRKPVPTLPQTLGNYEIRGELGIGGFGAVYEAFDKKLQIEVAIKVLRPREWAQESDRDALLAEARRICRVNHSNIVRAIAVDEADGFHFIVMEFIRGETLEQLCSREILQPYKVARLIAEAAAGLHAIHDKEIRHGDVKLSNMMLDEVDGRVKIMDFGLARDTRREGAPRFDTDYIVGTPGYLSPEQLTARAKADHRSDIFSLGVVLFRLLTGEMPFQGRSLKDLRRRTIGESPGSMRGLVRNVPVDLEAITLKCLVKEPANRYQSADEVSQDLNRWLDKKPIKARPVGWWERQYLRSKRNRVLTAVSTLAGLACILLLVIGVWSDLQVRNAYAVSNLNYSTAHFTLDLVTRRLQHRLANEPGTSALRSELLESSLPFYEEILLRNVDTPGLKAEVADAHFRTAYIRWLLGDSVQAERHYREAERRYAPFVIKEARNNDSTSLLLAIYLGDRVELCNEIGIEIDSESSYRDSISILEKLARAQPDVSYYQELSAITHSNFGALVQAKGNSEEAGRMYAQAVQLLETLIDQSPPSNRIEYAMATAYSNLAGLKRVSGDAEIALELYSRADEIWKHLLQVHPDGVLYRQGAALTRRGIGLIYDSQGRRSETIEEFEHAQADLQALLDENPLNENVAIYLAETSIEIGRVAISQNDSARALREFAMAAEVGQPVLARDPENVDARRLVVKALAWRVDVFGDINQIGKAVPELLALIDIDPNAEFSFGRKIAPLHRHTQLGYALVKAGEYREAVDLAVHLMPRAASDGEESYNLACVLSLAGLAVTNDATLDSQQQGTLLDQYRDQALKLLRKEVTIDFLRHAARTGTPTNYLKNDLKPGGDLDWLAKTHRSEMAELLKRISDD